MTERAGSQTADGFTLTACYFGPPIGFYPRALIFVALVIASCAVLKQTFVSFVIAVIHLLMALFIYIFWWFDSARVFESFENNAGIKVFGNTEIRHVAYLYGGTTIDVLVASSLAVCSILALERLFRSEKEAYFVRT